MKYINIISLFFVLFFFTTPIYVDEKADSIFKERSEIISYGIDSQIVPVIDAVLDKKSADYNEILLDLLKETYNQTVTIKIIQVFAETQFEAAQIHLRTFLLNPTEFSTPIIIECLKYFAHFLDNESKNTELIIPFIDNPNSELARTALTVLRNLETNEYHEVFKKKLLDPEYPENLRAELIKTIGTLNIENLNDYLLELVQDPAQPNSIRWNACQAIGEMAIESSFDVLKKLLRDEDTYLRLYTVSAIKNFNNDEVKTILFQALKDPFWRVRVAAARGLGKRGDKKSFDILKFKAEKDPEYQVRIAAIEALGALHTDESYDFLTKLLTEQNENIQIRITACNQLMNYEKLPQAEIIGILEKEYKPSSDKRSIHQLCSALSKNIHKDLQEVFKKMLTEYNDLIIQISALRGIKDNGFSDLREFVEEYTKATYHGTIQKNAQDTLDSFLNKKN